MDKKELRKHPIINIEPEWVRLIDKLKHTDVQYFVAAEMLDKDIIILNIIDKSQKDKISYRVFISKDDYITQDFTYDSVKWKTGALEFILPGNTWYKKCISIDDNSSDMLSKFLCGYSTLGFIAINRLQNQIKEKKLTDKHRIIKDIIDNKVKDVPNLPKNLDRWINEKVLFDSRYIYYNYKPNKVMEGYCTHCGHDVNIKSVKHNSKGNCPNCKSPITYKSIGKAKNVVDYGKATLIQKVKDHLVIRHFDVVKYYRDDYRNPTLEYQELQRHFIDKETKLDSYEFRNFKHTGKYRWCEGIRSNDSCSQFYSRVYDFSETVLYTSNLTNVLKDSFLKYSGLKEFAQYKGYNKFSIFSYIRNYLAFPGLEYLVKLKLYNLADDILNSYRLEINTKGNNLFEVLGINKTQLRTLQRLNGGFKILRIIKETGKVKLNLSDEEISYIANNTRIERVIKASMYTTVHQMLEYVISQSSDIRGIDSTFSDWLDYIGYCKALKRDLKNDFVLFPVNLTKSHDELSNLIKAKKIELYNSRITEMYEVLNGLLSWEYKDKVIVVPKSYDDIIKEGDSLKHCVGKGTYGKKIIEGESIILFIRNKNEIDKPFYTVELDAYRKEVIQCRGKCNKSTDNELKKILEVYERERLSRLELNIAV